ncbi:MAG TPA: ADOP family duplicated permease [Gemmatimonadaceae bacterium]|nr:ADOP family duplicated permease [Gemmatimonadaceae bacterium]
MYPPRLPLAILRTVLPRAEREEIVADLIAEYREIAMAHGERNARAWIWRQALGTARALVPWALWRESTAFEPRANAYRPGGPMLKHFITDARYALRRLRARPTYALLSVLTLALGIGGTAAVYAIARPVLFDPLPYRNEKEVASFWMSFSWNEQEFTWLRGRFPGFQSVAMYNHRDLNLQGTGNETRLLSGVASSAELFDILGTKPALGNTFKTGDDVVGADPVAILSYGLWREMGGEQSIIGSRLTLNGIPRTVIGVMPRGFWFPTPEVRVWVPMQINPNGRNGSYALVGLVQPGKNPDHMEPDVDQLVSMLKGQFQYPVQWDKTKNAKVQSIHEGFVGPMRPALVATMAAMVLVLIIACVNVAALMLGQVESRASELAVRAALGANRNRLTQPLIVEALIIGVAAAAVGAGLAVAGFRVLTSALPLGAWGEAATFDWTLFVAALALSVVSALLVVMIPSASLWRSSAAGGLQNMLSRLRTGGVRGGGAMRTERTLVVIEMTVAMLIASSATLLVRSVANMYAIDPGIDTHNVAVIDASGTPTVPLAERNTTIEQAVAALKEMPGVENAAAAMRLPLRGNGNSTGISVVGRDSVQATTTYFRIGTLDYFSTMGIKLVSGRVFDATDQPGGTISVVINSALAKTYFPGENPIGRMIAGMYNVPQQIIGVVDDVAEGTLTAAPAPARYYLWSQVLGGFGTGVTFVVRAKRGTSDVAVLNEARQTLARAAPGFGIRNTTTMSRVMDQAVGPARNVMSLLTALSVLALVLGAVGIYGVMAHFATRRKRDWAIRVALGLSGTRVVGRVLSQGAVLVVIGVVVGAGATLLVSRLLSTFLFGVSGTDPVAFLGATAALLVTGMIASFIPARRAGKVDPALVLREEA